jgi:hypothetical protein
VAIADRPPSKQITEAVLVKIGGPRQIAVSGEVAHDRGPRPEPFLPHFTWMQTLEICGGQQRAGRQIRRSPGAERVDAEVRIRVIGPRTRSPGRPGV